MDIVYKQDFRATNEMGKTIMIAPLIWVEFLMGISGGFLIGEATEETVEQHIEEFMDSLTDEQHQGMIDFFYTAAKLPFRTEDEQADCAYVVSAVTVQYAIVFNPKSKPCPEYYKGLYYRFVQGLN